MQKIKNIMTALFLCPLFLTAIDAQTTIGGAGGYKIEGGGTTSGGGSSGGSDAANTYSVTSAIGQPATGASGNGAYSVKGGSFAGAPLAPTAAQASVSGRVTAGKNRGLVNAFVYLTDMKGETRVTRTTAFGYYRFDGIDAGQTVVISIISKRFTFEPQTLTINEDRENLNFAPLR